VDTFGQEVQGIFKGDYPKIPTISGDDPMELTRTIASRVVNMACVVGARPQDVSLLPINSGKEFAIYVDGQDTGYDLDMSKVQRFVAGYQGYQSQTVLPEYGNLARQRAELMSDLEPYLMKKFMTPEEKDEYDEVLGQIYELNERSSEISDFSAIKMIKGLPDLAFDIFTNEGGR
jgi:hypothetical protein